MRARGFYLIALLICLILLNGCSTVHRNDGPPPFSIDETKIPDAVPKKEPLAKYGNYDSYRVFGKRYYTLKSSKNYQAKGIASWYGTKFHRMRTSSGEPYDMLGMTAAHKTLPLPTYVQVTNLKNGKKIIVKVNDRGPFESNRLIDLSFVAAKKLGMLGHGTAYVDVKAINFDTDHPKNTFYAHNLGRHPHIPANYPESTYYLQVGTFKNRIYAERLKTRLSKALSSPVRITYASNSSKHLYKVQIGPIRDTATAQTISKHLRSIGLTNTSKVKAFMEA